MASRNHSLPNIGVFPPLGTQGGHGTVAGDEAHVIPQWKEPLGDGGDQLVVIAPRKIRAPDGALEQDVAHLGEPPLGVEEHHMTGGVPGAMDHREDLLAHAHPVTILQPAVRLEIRHRRKAEEPALGRQGMDQKGILPVRPDNGHAQTGGQGAGRPHVVDMTMGKQDALGGEGKPPDQVEYEARLPPGIDDRGPPGPLTPQEGTVLLEGGDGEDAEVHGASNTPRRGPDDAGPNRDRRLGQSRPRRGAAADGRGALSGATRYRADP